MLSEKAKFQVSGSVLGEWRGRCSIPSHKSTARSYALNIERTDIRIIPQEIGGLSGNSWAHPLNFEPIDMGGKRTQGFVPVR